MKHKFILLICLATTLRTAAQTNTFPTTGNVGIGTTSPGTTLQVNGHTSLGDAYDPISYGLVQIVRPSSPSDNKFHLSFVRYGMSVSGMGYLPGSNTFGIWHANSNVGVPALAITTDQKIGIGNATPNQLLHVHNVIAPANTIGSVSEIANFSGATANFSQFKFLHRRHTLNGSWENVGSRLQFVTDVTNQGYLEFNPEGDPYGLAIGSTNGEIMRFKLNKCVGIGTTNPREALQIGDRFTIQDGGWKTINYNAFWDAAQSINARLVAGPNATIGFTDQGNIIFQTAPTGAAESPLSNAVHAMIVHNSGQVGIGTSYTKTSFQDASFKLLVDGNIRARKVKVDQTSWPDYVFDSTYHLRPLADVETFIHQNKHLPEIISAAQVEAEGLDLGENQAALLRKIEELTLYAIDQHKKLAEQQDKINRQDKRLDELQRQLERLKKQ
jgi:hypothetical protein